MNREERKAIARRFGMGWTDAPLCERYYPKCCQYHEGFDDALAEFLPDPTSSCGCHAPTPASGI